MVPRQRFNELKPNSGWGRGNSPEFTKKKIFREMRRDARGNCVRKPAALEKGMHESWPRRVPFVVEQMREKFTHIARRVEMSRDAVRATADGECKAVIVRHDTEHRFVGD